MALLRDHLWIWGHPANSVLGRYKAVTGPSSMTPIEGALHLGARNVFFVPWVSPLDVDRSTLAADHLRSVGWAMERGRVAGHDDARTELAHLKEVAERYPNFDRVILDDFFAAITADTVTLPAWFTGLGPAGLAEERRRLHESPGALSLWAVWYSHQLHATAQPYVDEFDGLTLWFWTERDVANFDRRCEDFFAMTEGKQRMIGCYLFNFGEDRAATPELVVGQLDRLREFLHDGVIEGIVLHTNAVADLGFPAVRAAKDWVARHGDEPVAGQGA